MSLAGTERTRKFPADRGEERSSKDAGGEQTAEERHRFDTFPALALPVDVAQVEPERKFVEGERRGNSIEHGRETTGPGHGDRIGTNLHEPDVADREQQKNAPDQVVDVTAVHGEVVKRADVVTDGECDAAHHQCCDEEGEGGEKQPFAARVGEVMPVSAAQPGAPNDRGKDRQESRDERGRDPKAALVQGHGLLFYCRIRWDQKIDIAPDQE